MSAAAARGTLDVTTTPIGGTPMSTAIKEQLAPARRLERRRVVRLALGGLGLVVALALIGGAIAGIVGLETKRDATGYFVTHTHRYHTPTYALSTESLNVGGVTGALEAGLVRLRIGATSEDAAKPLFIGVARTDDVDRYLARVGHDELRDIKLDPFKIVYRRLAAGVPRALPSTQTFWQARSGGTGTQLIDWAVKQGRWTAVVMNADGSRDVSVDAQLAARLAGAWWFVAAAFVLGALALAGGVVLLRSGVSKEISR